MRAINLVPADARPGRVNGGKSGGMVYAFLGVLAVGAIGSILYAENEGKIATANKNLATVQQSASAYTQVATQYTSFQSAAQDAEDRIATVQSLAAARFDWAGALRELARLMPVGTQIETLDASVASGTGSGGGTLRASIPSPAISLTGCSPTQDSVANMITQFQAMRRVTNVTLETSQNANATQTITPTERRTTAKYKASLAQLNKRIGGTTPAVGFNGQASNGSSGASTAADAGSGDSGTCDGYSFTVDVFYAAGSAQASDDTVPSSTPVTQTVSSVSASTPATSPAGSTPASSTPTGN